MCLCDYFFLNATCSHYYHGDWFFNTVHPWTANGVLFLNHMRKNTKGKDQANELVSTLSLLPPETLSIPYECWVSLGWLEVILLPVKPLNGVFSPSWCICSSLEDIEVGGLFIPHCVLRLQTWNVCRSYVFTQLLSEVTQYWQVTWLCSKSKLWHLFWRILPSV